MFWLKLEINTVDTQICERWFRGHSTDRTPPLLNSVPVCSALLGYAVGTLIPDGAGSENVSPPVETHIR